MPLTYRFSMLLGLCLATALGVMDPLRVSGARTDTAMLKRIASRVDGRTGVIAIEASDPVPYVASQPDPKTFVVELRDVVAARFRRRLHCRPASPDRGRAGGERRRRRRRPSSRACASRSISRCGRACAAPATSSTSRPIALDADAARGRRRSAVAGPVDAIRDVRVQPRAAARRR